MIEKNKEIHLHLADSAAVVIPNRHVGVGQVSVLMTSSVQHLSVFRRSRSASRMPDGATLKVHLLAVTEWIAAFGTTGAGRVKVVIVTRL